MYFLIGLLKYDVHHVLFENIDLYLKIESV